MTQQTGAPKSEWLLNAVKQNPEGLLLLAAGAVLMMRKSSSSARPAAEPPFRGQSYGSEPRSYGGGIQDTASDYLQQAKDSAKSYADSASRYADDMRRSATAQSEKIVSGAQSAMSGAQSAMQNTINRVLQDQPLLIAAAGLAAGAAIASVFPATSLERSHLGPIGDDVTKAAGRMGERLQRAGVDASEKLKAKADERGLNTATLKEVAAEAAQTFRESLEKNEDTKMGSGNYGAQPGSLR